MIGTRWWPRDSTFPMSLWWGAQHRPGLYNNVFRSFERTFSLLTQVVGRCGRGNWEAVPSFRPIPDSPIIELAAAQPPILYQEEIISRKLHLYPPYCTMVGIGFSGPEQSAKGCQRLLGSSAV